MRVQIESAEALAVGLQRERQGGVDAMLARGPSERGPALVRLSLLDFVRVAVAQCLKAGPAVARVLHLVNLADELASEAVRLDVPASRQRDTGFVDARNVLSGEFGEPL